MSDVYQGTKPYLFISYAHRDSERVLPLIAGLQKRGFRVWYDNGVEAGTEWPVIIGQHLFGCSVAIIFLSGHAINSHNCRQEITFSINRGKNPLIVYLEDIAVTKENAGVMMQVEILQSMYRNRFQSDEMFLDQLCDAKLIQQCRETDYSIDIEYCYKQGKFYEDKEDYISAINWYTIAAKRNHCGAQIALGLIYENVMDLEDDQKAMSWYRAAALLNDPKGQYELGECYRLGIGVPITPSLAADWLLKSALQEFAPALDSLYILAEENCAEAQFSLGYYYYGRSAYLAAEAVNWLTRAAEQNHAQAQYMLGRCYLYGNGTTCDKALANKFIQMAAEQGDQDAIHFLNGSPQ